MARNPAELGDRALRGARGGTFAAQEDRLRSSRVHTRAREGKGGDLGVGVGASRAAQGSCSAKAVAPKSESTKCIPGCLPRLAASIVVPMECSAAFLGTALVAELRSSDKLAEDAARAWIARKSGHRFDPEAMYRMRWPASQDSATWSGFRGLSVRIMSDVELLQLEREQRRQRGLPPRLPWEAPLFRRSMGRAGGPRLPPPAPRLQR